MGKEVIWKQLYDYRHYKISSEMEVKRIYLRSRGGLDRKPLKPMTYPGNPTLYIHIHTSDIPKKYAVKQINLKKAFKDHFPELIDSIPDSVYIESTQIPFSKRTKDQPMPEEEKEEPRKVLPWKGNLFPADGDDSKNSSNNSL